MNYTFNTLDEVVNYFTDKGFRQFNPPNFASYYNVVTMLQKKYVDEKGIRYFIDIKVWDWRDCERVKENYSVEFEGQYYQKDTHNAVNFTFIDWKLEEVESWLDKLFDANLIEHYEQFDNY